MQDSWRITVNEIDRSRVAVPADREVGAMVVRASRGPNTPMYFPRGSSEDILDAFGPIVDSDYEYHELLEALEFNSYSPIYLSSFYKDGDTLGGAVVSPAGVRPFTRDAAITPAQMLENTYPYFVNKAAEEGNSKFPQGLTSEDQTKFPNGLNVADDLIVGNGTGSVSGINYPNGLSAEDKAKFPNGIDLTDYADPGFPFGAYHGETKADYFILTTKSPHKDGGASFGVKVKMDNTVLDKPVFDVSVFKKLDDGSWKKVEQYSDCSLDPQSLDKYKNSNYILTRMINSKYVDLIINPTYAMEALADDRWPSDEVSVVALGGGTRSDVVDSTSSEDESATRKACWDMYKQKRKYPVDIFMDGSGLFGIAGKFKELGEQYQKYSMYLLALPLDQETDGDRLEQACKNYSDLNFRNGVAYWNPGYVTTAFYGGTLPMLTTLIGRIGVKYAQMQDIYDAMPPCMIDEGGYGGKLDNVGNCGKIRSLKFDPSDELQKKLNNELGVNPIIWDPEEGTMIGGQKTLQDPSYKSDTSYVCHVRVFNYIKRNALSKVFVKQATKYNDDVHQIQVKSGLENIVTPLLSHRFLSQAKVVCGESNNTPEVKARREFIASMAVKVTPTSETIVFNFINVDQSTDVNEVI